MVCVRFIAVSYFCGAVHATGARIFLIIKTAARHCTRGGAVGRGMESVFVQFEISPGTHGPTALAVMAEWDAVQREHGVGNP